MRRTEQEFKEEVLKRSRAYRQKRAKQHKKLLSIGMCVCLCFAVLKVFDPFGAKSEAPAADMMAMDELKTEMSMAQSAEHAAANAAPMEKEPAAAPEEVARNEMVSGAGNESALSRSYNVVAIEVKTCPETEEHYRFFTDIEKTVPVIVAIERFYSAGAAEETEQTGMAYEIVVTYKNRTVSYSLVGDGLYSESEGWIGTDTEAAGELKDALSQAGDPLPDVSVSKFQVSNSWPLSTADALAVQSYLETGEWIGGTTRSHMDYTVWVDGTVYTYSSGCGVFYDAERNASLLLNENDHLALNQILETYLPDIP